MIENHFVKHDVNADGKLDKTEGKALMQDIHAKFSSAEWNEEAFEAGFAAADEDKDGHIDKAELHKFLLARANTKGMIA